MPAPCTACFKDGASFICSRCKCTYYCDVKCQTDDWKVHKTICKSLAKKAKNKNNPSVQKEVVFKRLNDPPVFHYPSENKPIYYPRNGSYIFIIVSRETVNSARRIIKYDLDTQKVTETYKYPFDSEYGWIDVDNCIIHIISEENVLRTFNFNTKQIINTSYEIQDPNEIALSNAVFIPSPINELHFSENNTHFKYDETNQLLVKLQDNIGTSQIKHDTGWINDRRARFIYHKSSQQLMMFQDAVNHILVCKIQEKNQQIFNWNKYQIKLPQKVERFCFWDVVLGWDQILFWFHFTDASIWALDLLHPNKWYPSKHAMQDFSKQAFPYAINDKENNVHLMEFFDNNRNYHYRASLRALLPLEILEENIQKCDLLVTGYVEQSEKNHQLPYITSSLKHLVLKFYSAFV